MGKRDANDVHLEGGPDAVRSEFDRAPQRQDHDQKPQPRFKLIAFADLKPRAEPFYLVKGLIPQRGITVIWGPPKCGKSFWTFDILAHVSLGWDYRGRKVRLGPVVYCAFEGGDGFGARAEAFRRRRLAGEPKVIPDFYLVAARIDLIANHPELIAAIRAQLDPDCTPVAIALDTLNRSIRGSESDDRDMSAYVDAADAIRRAFDCAVIIVHHCGIDDRRPRGHTSLTGAADAQLAVKRDNGGNIVVSVEWMKDGPEGDIVISRLVTLEVGHDSAGDPISSCAVIAFEGVPPGTATGRKLSPRQQLALECLMNCVAGKGVRPPEELGLPTDILAVPVEYWREEMFKVGALDSKAKNPREDFKRVKTVLLARHLIGERDGLVWSVARSGGGQDRML
jgi:hypothetical protein